MHAHNVYFWLKNDLTPSDLNAFEQGLQTLTHDPAVKSGYYGRPADTHREVVENSYTYGLLLLFDDLAGHDQYQAGAVHLKFVEAHASKWAKVIVHDIQTI